MLNNTEIEFNKLIHTGELPKILSYYNDNKDNINISAANYKAFRIACAYGYLPVAKWLVSIEPNCNILKYKPLFIVMCENGELEIVKWLLTINDGIHNSLIDKYAFYGACSTGQLDTAQFLLSICPEIYESAPFNDKNNAYYTAQMNGHNNIVEWLTTIN
jgi:ankyrin repeat protein